jgi:hypothetical protein
LLQNQIELFVSAENNMKVVNGKAFVGLKKLEVILLQFNVCISEGFENIEVFLFKNCAVVEPESKFVLNAILSFCGISISVVVGLLFFWKFWYKNSIEDEPSALTAAEPQTTPPGSAEPATKTSASLLTTPAHVNRSISSATSSKTAFLAQSLSTTSSATLSAKSIPSAVNTKSSPFAKYNTCTSTSAVSATAPFTIAAPAAAAQSTSTATTVSSTTASTTTVSSEMLSYVILLANETSHYLVRPEGLISKKDTWTLNCTD